MYTKMYVPALEAIASTVFMAWLWACLQTHRRMVIMSLILNIDIYIYSGFVTADAVFRILPAMFSFYLSPRVVGSSVPFLGVCSLSSLVWVFPFFFSCLVPNPTSFWATVLRFESWPGDTTLAEDSHDFAQPLQMNGKQYLVIVRKCLNSSSILPKVTIRYVCLLGFCYVFSTEVVLCPQMEFLQDDAQ
jgi:hypothetical protein